jgi:hypothetical protein
MIHLQPDLHIVALLEGADLVAHDALQIVGKPAAREDGAPRQIGLAVASGS